MRHNYVGMKKNGLIGLVALAALLIGFLFLQKDAAVVDSERLHVVASFYPLAHFAEIVGGERVDVLNLTPTGAEPHDYEPTPRDIVALRNAKLILLNGAGFEPWFASLEKTGDIRGAIATMADHVDLLPTPHEEIDGEDPCAPDGFLHDDHCDCFEGHHAEGLSCVENGSDEDQDEGIHEDDEEDHDHGPNDPHIWLDPVRAQKEVEVIRDALATVDPAGQEIYAKNAAMYLQKLVSLHDEYQKGLASCQIRTIIVPHNAFQYLGQRYDITIESIAGVSPDEEPSPKRMAELSDIAKARGVKYIFFETLVSPKLAETIAKEAGIDTLVLNPVEGLTVDDEKAGETYISLMQKNLEQLRKAMDCQ